MKKLIPFIRVTQPIGTFYISALEARTILRIAEISNFSRRQFDSDCNYSNGSSKCVHDISIYCADPDATFPTPIIIAVTEDISSFLFENNILEIDDGKVIGEVIDGQHRLLGIKESEHVDDFVMPVVFMFGLTEEEKAYVFSIINSKQTQFSMSLLYKLFNLSDKRSPQKTCHHIARLLNADEKSAFYKRLKMLGSREGKLSKLSQGLFAQHLISLISNDPETDMMKIKRNTPLKEDPSLPLRRYFIAEKDEYIYKILFNLFNAIKAVFPEEWDNPKQSVLSNTVGYVGIMQAFPKMHQLGEQNKSLKQEFFMDIFEKVKKSLKIRNENLSHEFYPNVEATADKIEHLVVSVLENEFNFKE